MHEYTFMYKYKCSGIIDTGFIFLGREYIPYLGSLVATNGSQTWCPGAHREFFSKFY